MHVHALVDSIPWFGRYSGYEQLVRHLPDDALQISCTHSRTSLNQIRLGRAYRFLKRWSPDTNPVLAAAELRYAWTNRIGKGQVGHVLYGEMHHRFYERWENAPSNVVATLHHPPEQHPDWPDDLIENLRRLSSAIILYEQDLDRFEDIVGKGRVYVTRHGVDTQFFRPAEEPPPSPRLLFAGQNGRHDAVVREVIERLSELRRDLRFDLLVRPEIRRRSPHLNRLADHPAVEWHHGVGDEQLRELYQRATAVLLPMRCAGAVNTLLEALACGVPPLTNDIGGARDYGGGDAFPIAERAETEEMISLALRFLDDQEHRRIIAERCREFAERKLAWPQVAALHRDIYRAIARGV